MLACYCACVPLFRLLQGVLALHLGAHILLGGVCEMVGTFLGGSFVFMSLHDGLECYEVCAGLENSGPTDIVRGCVRGRRIPGSSRGGEEAAEQCFSDSARP